MSKTPDNPPAFPYPVCTAGGYPREGAHGGMTLLDWFAGQALLGLLARDYGGDRSEPGVSFNPNESKGKRRTAEIAYNYACAMLEEKAERDSAAAKEQP